MSERTSRWGKLLRREHLSENPDPRDSTPDLHGRQNVQAPGLPREPVRIVWIEPVHRDTVYRERETMSAGQARGSASRLHEDPADELPHASAFIHKGGADSADDTVATAREKVMEAADLLLIADVNLWEGVRQNILPADASVDLLEARILLLRAGIEGSNSSQGGARSRLSGLSSCIAIAKGKLGEVAERVEAAEISGDEVAFTREEVRDPIVEVIGRLAALEILLRQATDSGASTDCRMDVPVRFDELPALSSMESGARTRPRRGEYHPSRSSYMREKIEIRCGDEAVGVYSRPADQNRTQIPRSPSGGEAISSGRRIPATKDERRAPAPQPSEIPAVIPRQRPMPQDRPRGLPAFKASALGLYSRPREASQKTEENVEIRRSDVDAYLLIEDLNARGVAHQRAGMYDEALSCFERILEIEPDHPVALSNRGIVLRQLGRLKEAEACFDRVLSRSPSSAAVWMQKSQVQFQRERYPEALQSLDRVLALEPDRGVAWRYRAEVLQKLGRTSEAADSLERAKLLDPGG